MAYVIIVTLEEAWRGTAPERGGRAFMARPPTCPERFVPAYLPFAFFPLSCLGFLTFLPPLSFLAIVHLLALAPGLYHGRACLHHRYTR